MPDRPLTEEETRKFIQEHVGDIFKGLKAFQEEKTKPTLHDLCIIELNAKAEGLKRIVIEQGREIIALKEYLAWLEPH